MTMIEARKESIRYLSLLIAFVTVAFLCVLVWLFRNYNFSAPPFWLGIGVSGVLLVIAIALHRAIMRTIKKLGDE